MAALEPCIPCIKQLLNGLAAFKHGQMHKLIGQLEVLVAEGRLSKAGARGLYDMAISVDKNLIAACDEFESAFLASVAPPAWLVEASSEEA